MVKFIRTIPYTVIMLVVAGCGANKSKLSNEQTDIKNLPSETCFMGEKKQADGSTKRALQWLAENDSAQTQLMIEFDTDTLPTAGTTIDFAPDKMPFEKGRIGYGSPGSTGYTSGNQGYSCNFKVTSSQILPQKTTDSSLPKTFAIEGDIDCTLSGQSGTLKVSGHMACPTGSLPANFDAK